MVLQNICNVIVCQITLIIVSWFLSNLIRMVYEPVCGIDQWPRGTSSDYLCGVVSSGSPWPINGTSHEIGQIGKEPTPDMAALLQKFVVSVPPQQLL